MSQIELLAPAGDLQRAKVAFLYGADAVYVGGKRFSLRARASNFEIGDLKEAADFAHSMGKKLFVTVNMIAHEEDLDGLESYLKELNEIHVDAIIVASLAIAQLAQQMNLSYEVHLSTQLSITNSKAMEFYKSLGIDRVVLARELDLQTITDISSNTILPTEVFIHGGMCVNYSGRCTLSNDMTLRDANRGGCAQSCRWAYELTENDQVISKQEDPFTMGSKDLQTLDLIENLIQSKVVSLKIEGRMKSAYYIAVIVKAYRLWIDALLNKTADQSLRDQLIKELNQAENRSTFDGFLNALPNRNGQVYVNQEEAVVQNFIGTVLKVKDDEVLVEMRNNVKLGELCEVFGPSKLNESFILTSLYDEKGNLIQTANKPMAKLIMKIPCVVHVGDFIRRKGNL
ncbi:MAG: U32 family peptidase [Erysipelotrichaceae bacterium]|nr:U32 family peptidase [Erysipelotrichaceae bacterium]